MPAATTLKLVDNGNITGILETLKRVHDSTKVNTKNEVKISEGITKRSVGKNDLVKNEYKIENLPTMKIDTEKETTSESSTTADSSSATTGESSTTSATSVNTETTQPENEKLEQMKNNPILRKWDGKKKIVFLHIGKNGGTSFDKLMMGPTVKDLILKFYVYFN